MSTLPFQEDTQRAITPAPTFATAPAIVRAVTQGERLAHGYLVNATFATETARIDPLPHQRIAVYERMLPEPRLRFLLADDAGAGKTIMTGLYIAEMLARRLIRRVLIVAPAGLVDNWESELRILFDLHFQKLRGAAAKGGSPFCGPQSDLIIVSVDTLAGENFFARLQEPDVAPYDLVVFDEAHKLAAHLDPDFTVRKTDRYRLAEALAGANDDDDPRWRLGWHCHHLLLLTATPHMGKDFPYYCLWRLLEPDALATLDAFTHYPDAARRRHFIRRVKEEMVRFDGAPIYPRRHADTLRYELSQGLDSERQLYDETTEYIRFYYNRAGSLNRSAAQMAMGVFQRRLASSTYALHCSLERRRARLTLAIDAIRQGRPPPGQPTGKTTDVLAAKTADEEAGQDGREENEVAEEELLGAFAGVSLPDLLTERTRVDELIALAQRVKARQALDERDDSKFERLRSLIQADDYRREKFIVFTEHRDTLDYLVRRLEAIGFAGLVAQIHGGMDSRTRTAQLDFFRQPLAEQGAQILVATDAAGEGLNMQFCWLMINYDIPWNPARLEQRMGRIHRYGQRHDPVIIANLVAGNTREGKVLARLLEKLALIAEQLGKQKVYDVVGRIFEEISIQAYVERALLATDEAEAARIADAAADQLSAAELDRLAAADRARFGAADDVAAALPRLQRDLAAEVYRRLLPGYVAAYLDDALAALSLTQEGDPNGCFTLQPQQPGALDWLLPHLERYPAAAQRCLTVQRPTPDQAAIFLHPGEPVFEAIRRQVTGRFADAALAGACFVDPAAPAPYIFQLATVAVVRAADAAAGLPYAEVLASQLVALRIDGAGHVEPCPVGQLLLLLDGDAGLAAACDLTARAGDLCAAGEHYLHTFVANDLAAQHRTRIEATLAERLDHVRRGYDYREAELADRRARYRDKADKGDANSKRLLTQVKAQQQRLGEQRALALRRITQEPALVAAGAIQVLAHALVLPSSDPAQVKRQQAETEAIAMQVALAYEAAEGDVLDVSRPHLALAAGLEEWPGYDLKSRRRSGEERAIEVKGRAAAGEVELKVGEWIAAHNLGDRYWLYVVYDCAATPRLLRIQNPYQALAAKDKGAVVIGQGEIVAAAE
jgi:superfamily II DNA or RNA helicase